MTAQVQQPALLAPVPQVTFAVQQEPAVSLAPVPQVTPLTAAGPAGSACLFGTLAGLTRGLETPAGLCAPEGEKKRAAPNQSVSPDDQSAAGHDQCATGHVHQRGRTAARFELSDKRDQAALKVRYSPMGCEGHHDGYFAVGGDWDDRLVRLSRMSPTDLAGLANALQSDGDRAGVVVHKLDFSTPTGDPVPEGAGLDLLQRSDGLATVISWPSDGDCQVFAAIDSAHAAAGMPEVIQDAVTQIMAIIPPAAHAGSGTTPGIPANE